MNIRSRRMPLRRLTTSLLAAALILAGCETPGEPAAGPAVAPSIFRVVTVGGQSLPMALPVLGRAGCASVVLFRSEFAFSIDGTFEQRFWFTPDSTEQPAVFRTSFEQRGAAIHVSDGAGSGSLSNGTLRLDMPETQVCAALEWRAVRQ